MSHLNMIRTEGINECSHSVAFILIELLLKAVFCVGYFVSLLSAPIVTVKRWKVESHRQRIGSSYKVTLSI
ncbi:hypothetical protein KY46_04035 [Photobacterium halotolerans]|uniref:Uncharacterized protein n=1 Tax=Photobacterium halotolerans TaxID=265726 RepID=A0A0F5VFQ9_9GAMM|nr:hypothetical protein KY46_04035 [Photobacterium halotolerans]